MRSMSPSSKSLLQPVNVVPVAVLAALKVGLSAATIVSATVGGYEAMSVTQMSKTMEPDSLIPMTAQSNNVQSKGTCIST